MDVQPRVLDHPFYQAWERGELSGGQLAVYHRSYADFIQRIPSYWQRVVDAFLPDLRSTPAVVQDEREHILLWHAWGRTLASPVDYPRMNTLLDTLDVMTPSQLLGALQAFEIQQPEVAVTKKTTLLRYYGFREGNLSYFDAHQREEAHIAFGRRIAERYADPKEFKEGFDTGAKLVYSSLDAFLMT